jgi:glutamate formiminotransferase
VTLLAIPNVSEGRDQASIDAIARAFETAHARLLDVHTDTDHHRSVFTLAGEPGDLANAVLDGAAETVRQVDLNAHEGIHPRVGAIDVAPIVYLDPADRGAACS